MSLIQVTMDNPQFLQTPSGAPAETTEIVELFVESINNITRKTDVVGEIDPYVIVSAIDILAVHDPNSGINL